MTDKERRLDDYCNMINMADEKNFKFVVNYAKTDQYDNSQAFFNNQSDAEKFVKVLKKQGFNHFYRLKKANED